ncbi:MAG: Gfo/Idh/MocA family oxidoreductase [Terriglobia bacterium]|jgi:predicted dehydrogenase|nr:Gfo/Idh/MocA family oxidoreductase [Terriglobia bacterium]
MIRYGIAGFGLHAVKRLMPGFTQANDSRVVALSRRNPEKAKACAAEYKIPHAFLSTVELCQCPEVDAILVASPDAFHLQDVLIAAEHKKHVLCEKPMAMNSEQAAQMVMAARNAGVLLGVAHCFRFENSLHRIRERVSTGEIGDVVFARAEFSYAGANHPRTWLTDASMAAGGPVADVGVHCIDALRFVLEDDPLTVQAIAHHDSISGAFEAAAILSLSFVRGVLATVLVSTRAEYRTPFEIVGTTGVLRADDALNVDDPLQLKLIRGGKVVDMEELSNDRVYARQVDAFSAAIERKAPFPVSGEEGARNQAILDAAYRSIRNGRTESVQYPF